MNCTQKGPDRNLGIIGLMLRFVLIQCKDVQTLTMSWGGTKIKGLNKMGSIFSEVLRFKGILSLKGTKMFVIVYRLKTRS